MRPVWIAPEAAGRIRTAAMRRTAGVVLIATIVAAALLVACSGPVMDEGYAEEVRALIKSGERAEASEMLRRGIYLSPDSYELHFLMGELLYQSYIGARPANRGLYLARHYFARAEALAGDATEAAAARAGYDRVLSLQGR